MAKKSVKDSALVSTQRQEIMRISKRFVSRKSGDHVPSNLLYFLQDTMRVNLGKCKRKELEAILAILGYGRDPQIDERKK